MKTVQPGILAPLPRLARHLTFSLKPQSDPAAAMKELGRIANGEKIVVGIGQSLALALNANIAGLKPFPVYVNAGIDIPSTPAALWCWLRGDDRGELVHQTRQLRQLLAPAFLLTNVTDAFQYKDSRDLTGYEDGTENPEGADALEAAIVQDAGQGMDGSSFVAIQQWVHNLTHFQAMSQTTQDHTIGRRKSDNEELDNAPKSAHVKRTAQEAFEPEAFVLRRSMPWADAADEGLVFVAFGRSFDAFEAQLYRMSGLEDGTPDALFSFTRPVTGSYFWCPPVKDGRLDLKVLGLD